MCFGSYRTRVLIGSCWPIAVLFAWSACLIVRELRRSRRWQNNYGSPGGALNAVSVGLQRSLPLGIGLTFLMVPSTSTRIFKTFLCDPIDYDSNRVRRYLHADLSLSCDSEEYASASNTAYAAVIVWPVGVPVMYALLLWASRGGILSGTPTSLSRATNFMSGDYKASAFWWEVPEMCRKLVLTGASHRRHPRWVLLIDERAELARVLLALLVSITFLALELAIRPIRG
eukprot:5072226-Prymnesium_polylepis.2